jgi:hypothetical protein
MRTITNWMSAKRRQSGVEENLFEPVIIGVRIGLSQVTVMCPASTRTRFANRQGAFRRLLITAQGHLTLICLSLAYHIDGG